MGKSGHREKWVKGKLYIFCTRCGLYKLPEEFDTSTYVKSNKKRSLRSGCKQCHSLHGNSLVINLRKEIKEQDVIIRQNLEEEIIYKQQIKELKGAIKNALRIKYLWLPGDAVSDEYIDEARALSLMESQFKQVLKK